jgi:hypothetical protein
VVSRLVVRKAHVINPLKQGIIEGENPVFEREDLAHDAMSIESGCLGVQL